MDPMSPPADASDTRIGTVIGERYRLLERIGQGGMGAVYRAEHMLMKKVVAVKLLHPELGLLDEVAARFEREAQSSSRLEHASIIRVTDFGRTESGELFLVMEFLVGESLAALLERSRKIPVERAIGIMRQVLAALEHAHAAGVVHRDLKPDNIMLTRRESESGERDSVKLLDFGIAKLGDDSPVDGKKLTQAGVIFGTPHYMSPEQAMGEETDARADLYSCGVILYEMLAGRKPFEGDSAVAIISQHLATPPPPLRSLAPEVPESVAKVVLRALTKHRDQRFQTADAFRQALDEATGAAPRKSGIHVAAEASAPGRASRITFTIDVDQVRARAASLWNHRLVIAVRRPLSAKWERLPVIARRAVLAAAAVLLLALVVAGLRHSPSGLASTPLPPRPVEPAVIEPIRSAEQALARGDAAQARALLTQQLAAHPESAMVHFLLGHVAFLQRDREIGLQYYREAIQLDPGYRADATLIGNVVPLVDDKKLSGAAVEVLANDVGKPACAVLAQVASMDRRASDRHLAFAACERLGCAEPIDRVESYALDLSQGKTCEERRDAVVKLGKLGDRRALEPLRKLRRRGGSFFKQVFGGENDCMKGELAEAIKDAGG